MSGFALGAGFGAGFRSSPGGAAGGGGGGTLLPSLASLAGFGDSITVGQAASGTAQRWLDIVAAALGAGTPLNQGISGTVLQNSPDSGGSARANNGRDRFVSALLGANQRDGVCIAYGFNDARYMAAPGTFNVAGFAQDLGEVLSGLITGGYARGKIVVMSPYYITDAGLGTGSTGFTGQSRAGFETFVSAAADAAAAFGVFYADVYAWMRDHGGASLISGDDIHPNDSGHAAIAAGVLAASRPNLRDLPGVSASAPGGGAIGFAITPPAAGSVTNYTVEYAVEGSHAYGGGQTIAGTSGSWSGIAAGAYRVRVRANFADGGVSPWAFAASPVAVAGAFLSDSFTGAAETAITGRSPEIGGSWVAQTGYSPATPSRIDGANRLYSNSSVGVYRNSAAPPSANYAVEALFTWLSSLSGDNVGIAGRMQAGAETLYFVRYSRSSASWGLFKTVAGTTTQLGSSYSDSFTSGTRLVRLSMTGDQISVSIDGVTRIGPVTDGSITAAGHAGVRVAIVQSPTTGIHIDSIEAVA